MIHYVTGDATQPIGDGPKIICHVCNDIGAWGAGFVLALSKRWRAPEVEYRLAHYHQSTDGRAALGCIQLVPVENVIWVANMIAQRGTSTKNGQIPLRYDALSKCLREVAVYARLCGATLHMPRIGCGLAGGKWAEVEKVIEKELADYEVYVYDLPIPADTCAE